MRRAVEIRDKGVCRLCGRDTSKIEAKLIEFRKRYDANPHLRPAIFEECRTMLLGEGAAFAHRLYVDEKTGGRMKWKSLWEADHEHAVAEGGRASGLENLRCLCRECHLTVTHEMQRRVGY